jgi:hypothetical protein
MTEAITSRSKDNLSKKYNNKSRRTSNFLQQEQECLYSLKGVSVRSKFLEMSIK